MPLTFDQAQAAYHLGAELTDRMRRQQEILKALLLADQCGGPFPEGNEHPEALMREVSRELLSTVEELWRVAGWVAGVEK